MGTPEPRNVSYWIATTAETDYPPLSGDESCDVVVLGAGLAGLTTAIMLQEEGYDVVICDAGRIATGATGNTTAKITSQHGLIYDEMRSAHGAETARIYGEANQQAIEIIAGLVERYDIACDFVRESACVYASTPDGVDLLRAELAAATELGLPARFTPTTQLPFQTYGALWFDNQAMFHARAFCLGLAEAFVERGGRLYEMTRATEVKHGEPCTVTTDRGTVRADDIVMCTHIPFPADGMYFARTAPYQSYAMAVDAGDDVPGEMYLSAEQPVRSMRVVRYDGRTRLIVGGESHKTGQEDEYEKHYQALESWARAHFDVRSIEHRWTAQDFFTSDRIPFIGPITEAHPRILVATGFKKWGMTTSAVAAKIITDSIAARPNPWADVFDPARSKGFKAAMKSVQENINVAKHWVGDRLKTGAPAPEDLAPGEGAICSAGGDKVACYRDEAGELHSVSAKCTHLGCLVDFNDAERTWDCPCHGSRFATDGTVIQGPATKDLKQVALSSDS